MTGVTALGGVFIRATDPEALAAWYQETLGLTFEGASEKSAVLPDTGSAYAVVALFPRDSSYLGDPNRQQAMINLRVDDLAAVYARLDTLGVAHDAIEDSEYGRFGWITDLEENRVELWQPA